MGVDSPRLQSSSRSSCTLCRPRGLDGSTGILRKLVDLVKVREGTDESTLLMRSRADFSGSERMSRAPFGMVDP